MPDHLDVSQVRPSAEATFPIAHFASTSPREALGRLVSSSQFDVSLEQRNAWEAQLPILAEALVGLDGHLFLEFDVPRLGSRIDAVVITGPAIFPIEFKVGETKFTRDAYNQAWDYALDLKNFHQASSHAPILPILVATAATRSLSTVWGQRFPDDVWEPYCTNATGLRRAIEEGLALAIGAPIDGEVWGRASYRPTPTIIQAARALYARHSVDAISRSDAGARNLAVTSKRVEDVIEESRRGGCKSIVFVTGVPGAGKTLVGLSIATRKRDAASPTHAVFLSGNGPLVAVLREALIRDELGRLRTIGERARKGEVAQKVKPFIQNVHHFRDQGVRDEESPPVDRVVVFDEAQRAWNLEQTSNFMRRRKKLTGFSQSEPQFLIGYMDRHPDWATIVCLVGGGQEINTGEAGIGAWLEAVREHFPHWRVYVSPHLTDSEYAAVQSMGALSQVSSIIEDPELHLSVSMRSFRSERVSTFVKALLDSDTDYARQLLQEISSRYPIAMTRDLATAKAWVREHARGSERFGLVASSQAERLKPYAIDVRVGVDPVHWFLNEANDTRSSYYLEDAATEFDVQGLELDWACVTWDADLRRTDDGWSHHRFRGTRWVNVHKPDRRQYLVNAYRVLLTRARQGMVIFVPRGDDDDPTRKPDYYRDTYQYLAGLGIEEIGSAT